MEFVPEIRRNLPVADEIGLLTIVQADCHIQIHRFVVGLFPTVR